MAEDGPVLVGVGEGSSADWVATQLRVTARTVQRALKDTGVALRPGGWQRADQQETPTHKEGFDRTQ